LLSTAGTSLEAFRSALIQPTPDFSDYSDRRGHIRRVQQSTLAGEGLANFSGFKVPDSCMTRGGHTSRLTCREDGPVMTGAAEKAVIGLGPHMLDALVESS
jgi:hypothetical protein